MESTPSDTAQPRVLIAGLSLVADLVACREEGAWDALEARWVAFEGELALAPAEDPLPRLVERLALRGFELKCVFLALGAQVEPKMRALVAAASVDLLSVRVTVRWPSSASAGRPPQSVKTTVQSY